MAKSKKRKKVVAKKNVAKKKKVVSDQSETIFEFNDGSEGTHLEQEKKMKHEDFPLFLRLGFEEAGEKINK